MTPKPTRKAPKPQLVRLPPIPSHLFSPMGDVPILVIDAKEMEKGIAGTWVPRQRAIALASDQSGVSAWQVLRHEWVHMILDDSGVAATLTAKQQESICDAIGSALVAEMIAKGTK